MSYSKHIHTFILLKKKISQGGLKDDKETERDWNALYVYWCCKLRLRWQAAYVLIWNCLQAQKPHKKLLSLSDASLCLTNRLQLQLFSTVRRSIRDRSISDASVCEKHMFVGNSCASHDFLKVLYDSKVGEQSMCIARKEFHKAA